MKVINLTTGRLEEIYDLCKVICEVRNNTVIFGYCSHDDKRLISVTYNNSSHGEIYRISAIDSPELRKYLVFSRSIGTYLIKFQWDPQELLRHMFVNGIGKDMDFPYNFRRNYEAADSFNIFDGRQKVIDNQRFNISNYFKYTFGLEFETSQGFVPEDICYRDGLIPLRDGSINGLEYSTVVLSGNTGFNLLKQQIDTLKEYTYFDKECSLHVHMGGYPVDPKAIFVFYNIACLLEDEIQTLIPRYSFKTSLYKATHKDYCNRLPKYTTFESLYQGIAEQEFFGDLTQPHPHDVERNHKWDCHTR